MRRTRDNNGDYIWEAIFKSTFNENLEELPEDSIDMGKVIIGFKDNVVLDTSTIKKESEDLEKFIKTKYAERKAKEAEEKQKKNTYGKRR